MPFSMTPAHDWADAPRYPAYRTDGAPVSIGDVTEVVREFVPKAQMTFANASLLLLPEHQEMGYAAPHHKASYGHDSVVKWRTRGR